MPSNGIAPGASRFDGLVEGLGLINVVRLNAANRFVGSITVEHGSASGVLFFRDGEIVHAQAGGESGEPAFFEIMRWPDAKYTVNADDVAPRDSILRGLKLLLADLQRPRAERIGDVTPPSDPTRRAATPEPRPDRLAAIVDEIRRIPGVTRAVLHDKDGRALGDGSDGPATPLEAELVALSRLGKRLGEAFRTGDLVAGVVHGSERNVLLLATRESQLTILIAAGNQADEVQARIRALLGARS